ncbi:MAG: hypothetical protein ACTH0S_06635 [Senegalia sp. (in: firmicutes)]
MCKEYLKKVTEDFSKGIQSVIEEVEGFTEEENKEYEFTLEKSKEDGKVIVSIKMEKRNGGKRKKKGKR